MKEDKIKFEIYQSPFYPENFQASVLQVIEQKAKDIIEKTNLKVQEIVSKGYQEGFQKGYTAGMEKVEKEKETYLSNVQKEFSDKLNELTVSLGKIINDYKESVKNLCQFSLGNFLKKYMVKKVQEDEQILLRVIDELFQYVSSAVAVKLIVNKKYEPYIQPWLETKKNEGYQIEIIFNDIDVSGAVIVGHNIHVCVDFNKVVDELMEKYII